MEQNRATGLYLNVFVRYVPSIIYKTVLGFVCPPFLKKNIFDSSTKQTNNTFLMCLHIPEKSAAAAAFRLDQGYEVLRVLIFNLSITLS